MPEAGARSALESAAPEADATAAVEAAVIVAAGKGERLADGRGIPKPLTSLVGVPLIRRVMACAARAGIRRFVVVIGFQAARLRSELGSLVPEGCALTLVENPRFEEPNGLSLRAGIEDLAGPFALLMSDHVFSAERLRLAREHYEHTGRGLLVVEGRERFAGDLEDATRVVVHAGRVHAIGKGLDPYDAVDTGMFVLDAGEVREALDRAGAAPSISDGMRVLAAAGRLDALELQVGFWQDVDTPADVRTAERKLYASLTKPNDGLLASLINRRISLFLSTRVWRIGLTPNAATAITSLFGLAAGVVFAGGDGTGRALLGASLFQLQSILDGVDGELARLLHKESRLGFWLDVGLDNLTHMAVFAGIALGQRAGGVPGPWGALALLSVLGVAACFALMAPLLDPSRPSAERPQETGLLGRLLGGLSRRDFTYLLFPLALFGWLGAFAWAAAVGTWVYALLVLVLRLRERSGERR